MLRLLVTAGSFLAVAAMGGDYFPMVPKRVTYEFGPSGANLPKSSALTIETAGGSLDGCEITALTIVVDGASIAVPKPLLKELGTVNLKTLDFHSFPGTTFLEFQFQRSGETMGSTIKGKYRLVMAKGKLTELQTETSTQINDYKTTTKKLQPD
jgi:hypothetical protein